MHGILENFKLLSKPFRNVAEDFRIADTGGVDGRKGKPNGEDDDWGTRSHDEMTLGKWGAWGSGSGLSFYAAALTFYAAAGGTLVSAAVRDRQSVNRISFGSGARIWRTWRQS